MKKYPPHQASEIQPTITINKPRSSNLELYRIICMLMIVAHHFVVSSGLTGVDSPLSNDSFSLNGVFLWLFGMWGKTGINCFMMITGYFMCTSKITSRKFIKLLAQVYFYNFVIYIIFLVSGYEAISVVRIVKLLMPFWGFGGDFIGCFIVFYLTIPFWTILVQNMNKRQHGLLLILLLSCYTILGSIPTFRVTFNYITWFGIIFLIASYIRLYPMHIYENKKLWRRLTLISVVLSMASVAMLDKFLNAGYFLISDCNKFFAVVVAVCSFLWFKNMDIKYSKVINAFGAATFGVLLIHANPGVMGLWLWKDVINAPSFYQLPFDRLVLASFGVVLAVFLICNLLDQIRISTIEKAFLKWYDKHIDIKLNKLIKSEQYV